MVYNSGMRTQIKATNIELTEAIQDYVEKKLNALEKFFGPQDDPLVMVEVGKITRHHKSGNVFRAEIRVSVSGQDHYAFVEKEDLYAAIDEVKDEIIREISGSKQKDRTLLRRGGAKIKALIKKLTW
jgi:putative sigma-54 modulation protein